MKRIPETKEAKKITDEIELLRAESINCGYIMKYYECFVENIYCLFVTESFLSVRK